MKNGEAVYEDCVKNNFFKSLVKANEDLDLDILKTQARIVLKYLDRTIIALNYFKLSEHLEKYAHESLLKSTKNKILRDLKFNPWSEFFELFKNVPDISVIELFPNKILVSNENFVLVRLGRREYHTESSLLDHCLQRVYCGRSDVEVVSMRSKSAFNSPLMTFVLNKSVSKILDYGTYSNKVIDANYALEARELLTSLWKTVGNKTYTDFNPEHEGIWLSALYGDIQLCVSAISANRQQHRWYKKYEVGENKRILTCLKIYELKAKLYFQDAKKPLGILLEYFTGVHNDVYDYWIRQSEELARDLGVSLEFLLSIAEYSVAYNEISNMYLYTRRSIGPFHIEIPHWNNDCLVVDEVAFDFNTFEDTKKVLEVVTRRNKKEKQLEQSINAKAENLKKFLKK